MPYKQGGFAVLRKAVVLILLVLIATSAVGCATDQQTDIGITITSKIDPNLYRVEIRLEGEPGSYSQTHGQFSGYAYSYGGYAHGVIWQEGKGLVRGRFLSVEPEVEFASLEDTVIVKTTDRRIMALMPGDAVELVSLAEVL